MTREATLAGMLNDQAVGIIRQEEDFDAIRIASAIAEGGVCCPEITMTTSGIPEGIAAIVDQATEVLSVQAPCVLDATSARRAIQAGVHFLVTPVCAPRVEEVAHKQDAVVIPGAMMPTEIRDLGNAAVRC